MKNVFSKGLYLVILITFLILTLQGCGGDSGGGGKLGLGNGEVEGSLKKNSKKPIQSFVAHIDVARGSMKIEYLDGKRKKGVSSKLSVTPNITISTDGVNSYWNVGDKIITAAVLLTNNSSDTLYGTYVTISSVTSGISVNNEYGYDPDGNPYFNHAPNAEYIASGGSSSRVAWKFSDPDAVNFSFSGNIYSDNWHQIAGDGIASTAWENADADRGDKIFIDSMTAFNGKLYVTMGKQVHPARDTGKQNDFPGGIGTGTGITGAEVWEYEPTGGTWSQINADGFGGSEDYLNFGYNNWGTSLAGFNGALYAGTSKAAIFGNGQTDPNNQQGAEIWRWSGSGTTWTKVHSMTDTKAIKDLLEFDGNLFATGYFRGYNKTPGTVTQARFDYSPTGSAGSWNIVMSDAFGDIDEQGTYGTSISSAVSNVQFGTSDKYLFYGAGCLIV